MGPYLFANLVVSQSFLELIEASYEYLLHISRLAVSKFHVVMEKCQNIIVYACESNSMDIRCNNVIDKLNAKFCHFVYTHDTPDGS